MKGWKQKIETTTQLLSKYGNNLERNRQPPKPTEFLDGKTRIWAVHDVAVNFGGISINGRQGEVLWLCCFGRFFDWFPFQKKLNEARKSSVI